MSKHLKHIRQAIELAKTNKGTKRSKHCSLLINGKSRVSEGFNSYTTHSAMYRINKEKPHLHSEVDAIMSARYQDLSQCTLYIARVTKLNVTSYSRPCVLCMKVIRMFEIPQIVYTTPDGYVVEKIR